jgi:hypothetical protein
MRSRGRLGGQRVVKQARLFRHSMILKSLLSERLCKSVCVCGQILCDLRDPARHCSRAGVAGGSVVKGCVTVFHPKAPGLQDPYGDL